MTESSKAFGYRLKVVLGGENLGSGYYKFLWVHTLFLVFTRIPQIFINTMLMNQTREVNTVLFYNGAIYAAGALTMVFSAQIMHKTNCKITLSIGIIGYNILYLSYILFQPYVGRFYLLFGLFNGISDGFYYISYGRLIMLGTNIHNRDSGMGIISTFGALVNLFIPFLSGSIIAVIGGRAGYVTIFVLAFGIALVTFSAVFRLPEVEGGEPGNVKYTALVKIIGKNRLILYGLLAETFKGVREGTFIFVLNIILYQLVKNEFLIGCNSLLTGLFGILSFWYMSRFFSPANRMNYMGTSVVILAIAALVCIKYSNPVMIVLFAVINAFFAGFIEVSCYTTFFDVSQSTVETLEFEPELLAFHELFVVGGRCAGLLLFALINTAAESTLTFQLVSLLLLTVIQVITIFCCRKAMKAN